VLDRFRRIVMSELELIEVIAKPVPDGDTE
jgi:hypothetical protein